MGRLAKRKNIKVDKEQARQRIKKIWPLLKKAYPDAKIALKFVNPLELLNIRRHPTGPVPI